MDSIELARELQKHLRLHKVTQYQLVKAGLTTMAARRVLGKEPGTPELASIEAAANLVGFELRLIFRNKT